MHLWILTCAFTSEDLHLLYVEVDIDTVTDIPATCWLSTCMMRLQQRLATCGSLVVDAFQTSKSSSGTGSIEFRSGKASGTVTVVVQCDGSQGDSCGEYEQQLRTTTLNPHVIVSVLILLSSKVGVNQFNWGTIIMDIVSYKGTLPIVIWIVPTFSTRALSSVDRVILIGIL